MPVRRSDVIDAAMELLDEGGLDRLSTRRIADRLGLRVGALYWHVKDKDELLAELADRILAPCLHEIPGTDPGAGEGAADTDAAARLTAAAHAVRRAMLAHPDGARLVAEYAVPGRNALVLADRLLGITMAAGVPLPLAAPAGDALLSYVTGFVLQEQRRKAAAADLAADEDPAGRLGLAELPHLAAALAHGLPGEDAAFAAGVGLITEAVTAAAR